MEYIQCAMLPLIIAALAFLSTWHFWNKTKILQEQLRDQDRDRGVLDGFRVEQWDILSRYLDRIQQILYQGYVELSKIENCVLATATLEKARSELQEWIAAKNSITPTKVLEHLNELEGFLIEKKDSSKNPENVPTELVAAAAEHIWDVKRTIRETLGL